MTELGRDYTEAFFPDGLYKPGGLFAGRNGVAGYTRETNGSPGECLTARLGGILRALRLRGLPGAREPNDPAPSKRRSYFNSTRRWVRV